MSTSSSSLPHQDTPAASIRTARNISLPLLIGLACSLVSVALFAWIWDQVKDRNQDTTQFDRSLLFWMRAHEMPGLTAMARLLAHMGSPPLMVCLALIAALLGFFWHKVRGAAWTLPIAVIGAGVIIQGIKLEFRRPRPSFFVPLLHETGYSFPSGHSVIAIVVYGLLGFFVMHLFQRHALRLLTGIVTVLLVLLIGLSRVYVGVHYPTDVLAGWTAGLPWLIACLGLHEILTRHFRSAGEPVLHLPAPTDHVVQKLK